VRNNPDLFGKSSTPIEDSSNNSLTWSGLPIIYDEVFTGLYRLGRVSCSSFLNAYPDISVHAKLLTGGLVPLSVTLASESIFKAFLSDKKEDALLHGHSYTAHPVGCQVALESLKTFEELDKSSWQLFKDQWSKESSSTIPSKVWSVWSPKFIEKLSYIPLVENAYGLGSVLAISLKDTTSGYASNATLDLQKHLSELEPEGWNVNTRGLGNVIYLMASQTITKETVEKLEAKISNFFSEN
jgi:dethiobiotin synthetase/adenosylmethionine--8-amino-7-oxononanoate aminotransferase